MDQATTIVASRMEIIGYDGFGYDIVSSSIRQPQD